MGFKLNLPGLFGSSSRDGAAALEAPTTHMAKLAGPTTRMAKAQGPSTRMAKAQGPSTRVAKAEGPSTRVANMAPPAGYDPLASVSIMEQLRGAVQKEIKHPVKLPLIGNLEIEKQFQILGVLAVLFLVMAAILLGLNSLASSRSVAAVATATEMQMLSQRLARTAAQASQGNAAGFEPLKDSFDRFRFDFDALARGGTVRGTGLDVSQDPAVQAALSAIAQRWERIDANMGRIVNNQVGLTALAVGVEGVNKAGAALTDAAESLGPVMSQSGSAPREIAAAAQLATLTQRIARTMTALAVSDEINPNVAATLSRDVATYRDTLNGLLRGNDRLTAAREPEPRRVLGEIQKRFGEIDSLIGSVIEHLPRIAVAKQAARVVNQESEPLLEEAVRLTQAVEREGRLNGFTVWAAVIFGVLALGSLVLLGKLFLDDARERAYESEKENRRNQEAILRLLNEMGNLADGDLTVQASVTEDITGAIADSINFTIDELRSLVKGINDATDEVTRATVDAQSISTRLYESSQRQNREIQQASASVLAMAQSINEVSVSAAQSARVAQQSLSAAEKGGAAVQDQISGMNEIRAQIQDTAKRIKRLGESSQEIGEIVELISDITEQTNVLALNAAIQAASAGEAGRGFTVVAEEVQRLAERSGEATKQIEAIVKMIQADTQDAISAMERSTEGVVEGAKLSDAAGQALQEIRQVSRELAELIHGISGQTQKQSASVSEVTRGMQGILKITEETSEGTKQTNVSIGQLTRLAAGLRSSVAGFKV
jgi:twitching motility protein PilJ